MRKLVASSLLLAAVVAGSLARAQQAPSSLAISSPVEAEAVTGAALRYSNASRMVDQDLKRFMRDQVQAEKARSKHASLCDAVWKAHGGAVAWTGSYSYTVLVNKKTGSVTIQPPAPGAH